MSAEFVIPDWMTPADGPSAPPPQAPVDDHRVEDLVNRFIAAKQDALFDAPDAYFRSEGPDAVNAAPAILDRLNALRDGTLDQADDDRLRTILGQRLDLHLADASDGIDRHAAAQRDILNRQIIGERQRLIGRAATLEHDNDDKLAGLAEAHASAAAELARMDGQPEGPALDAARSTIWRTVIDHRLANDNGPQALDLFDRVKDQLAPEDRLALDGPVQVARNDRAANQWITSQAATDGPPLRDRIAPDPDLPADVKLIVRTKLDARDSAAESKRAATSKALDDEITDSMRGLATSPNDYAPGTFAQIARAYDAAGEPDKAEATRRLAAQEAALVPFAQASVERQQRLIDDLPEGEFRDAALAIQRHQAAAFAKDAFAAGTTLYPDVGPPASIDDIKGRLRQARHIAARRSISVAPYATDEIIEMRRVLAEGSPDEQQTVRARLDAMPEEIRQTIEPATPDTASEPPPGTSEAPPPDTGRSTGSSETTPSTAPNGATTGNPLEGADVHVVHQDDGSAKVTASGVQTPAGKADVSFSANRDRRSATAETVLPDGRRIESRRTTPDGRTWSQIDTVRDADRTVRATLTTTFDGTRYSQTYAPADGEPRTATWNAAQDPSSPIQRVADEGVLPYAAMGAVIGFGAIAGAPLLAAAGVVGLALLALKGDTQDQGKPAPMEARRPQDGEDEDDEGTQGRKKRGHRDGPRPLVEGEVLRPPAQDSDPADSMEPGGDASSGKPPQLTKPYKPPHEQSDEDIDKIAEAIVEHAYGKHKDQGEFSNTEHARELFRHVKKIIKEHGEWKSLPDGRTAYWDKDSGTVVIHNPNAADQGTTHQPKGGRRYYDELE